MGVFMSSFFDKSGCELIYLASSLAIALSKGLNEDEISTLSAFVSSVGDNLAIIATQCSTDDDTPSNTTSNEEDNTN